MAGLPEPETNVELGDEWFFIGRVDLYLRAWNIAVEYEGDQHRTDARVFGHDLQRYEQLAASGVLVIRVGRPTSDDLGRSSLGSTPPWCPVATED